MRLYHYTINIPKPSIYEVREDVTLSQVFHDVKEWPGTKLVLVTAPLPDACATFDPSI